MSMDLEQQKLDEDIQQIELLLNTTDRKSQNERDQPDEELDSDDEDALQISVEDGLHSATYTEPEPSGSEQRPVESEGAADLQDYNYQNAEDEEELGDTLETALKLNRAYQELLRFHMANITELLHKNEEKQTAGQDHLFNEMTGRVKKPREYEVFLYPYFKDSWGSGPVKNKEAVLRESMFPKLEPPRLWKVFQEEALLRSLEEQMKTKCLKDLWIRLRKSQQGIADSNGAIEGEDDLRYTIDCVKSSFSLADIDVEEVVSHADWLTIANCQLEGTYSTESCIAMYRNICNPLINRSRWTKEEDERLKELVAEHGHQSWVKVAEELGTSRSAFLCLQRYQTVLNDYDTATWTEEKDDALYQYMLNNMGKEDVVNWYKVSWHVGEMTPTECKNHWEKISRGAKRSWTEEEDVVLAEAIKMYLGKMDARIKWMHIAAHVKTRNSMQCRDRWENRLNPKLIYSRFTAAEDKILFDYLVKFNAAKGTPDESSSYSIKALRDDFPRRVGNSISQRLKHVQKKMDNGTYTEKSLNAVIEKDNRRRARGFPYIDSRFKPDGEEEEKEDGGMMVQRRSGRKITANQTYAEYFMPYTEMNFVNESSAMRKTPFCRGVAEMFMESGKLTEIEIDRCLQMLLQAYPFGTYVSAGVLSSLEGSVRLMLDDPEPDFHLDEQLVRKFLRNRLVDLRRLRKQRDSRMKGSSATMSPVKKTSVTAAAVAVAPREKKMSLEVEREITSLLMGLSSATLPGDVSAKYSDLINQSMSTNTVQLTNLRIQCAEHSKKAIRMDLPYLLPPNQVTLNAYNRLIQNRPKLSHYARDRADKHELESVVLKAKETTAYQALRKRVFSLFFWPAVLQRCNPDAAIFQGMTVKKYNKYEYTDAEKELKKQKEEEKEAARLVKALAEQKEKQRRHDLTPCEGSERFSCPPSVATSIDGILKESATLGVQPVSDEPHQMLSAYGGPPAATAIPVPPTNQVTGNPVAGPSQAEPPQSSIGSKVTVSNNSSQQAPSPPPPVVFSVKAATHTGHKLPQDVAAIIFKALQEKHSKPVAKPPIYSTPDSERLRKPREGPFETVTLQLVTEERQLVKTIEPPAAKPAATAFSSARTGKSLTALTLPPGAIPPPSRDIPQPKKVLVVDENGVEQMIDCVRKVQMFKLKPGEEVRHDALANLPAIKIGNKRKRSKTSGKKETGDNRPKAADAKSTKATKRAKKSEISSQSPAKLPIKSVDSGTRFVSPTRRAKSPLRNGSTATQAATAARSGSVAAPTSVSDTASQKVTLPPITVFQHTPSPPFRKHSPRKQSSPRKSMSPSKAKSITFQENVGTDGNPSTNSNKIKSVLKQIRMRSPLKSNSAVTVQRKSDQKWADLPSGFSYEVTTFDLDIDTAKITGRGFKDQSSSSKESAKEKSSNSKKSAIDKGSNSKKQASGKRSTSKEPASDKRSTSKELAKDKRNNSKEPDKDKLGTSRDSATEAPSSSRELVEDKQSTSKEPVKEKVTTSEEPATDKSSTSKEPAEEPSAFKEAAKEKSDEMSSLSLTDLTPIASSSAHKDQSEDQCFDSWQSKLPPGQRGRSVVVESDPDLQLSPKNLRKRPAPTHAARSWDEDEEDEDDDYSDSNIDDTDEDEDYVPVEERSSRKRRAYERF